MKDSIIELSKKNELEYKELCQAHIIRANTFNIDVVIKQYYSFFINASTNFDFFVSESKLVFYKILRQVYKLKIVIRPQFRKK